MKKEDLEPKKAQITPSNVKGFIQGNFRKFIIGLEEYGIPIPKHIKEQAAWRLIQVKQKSPECFNQDKCIHCGCQVSAKVFEDRACSNTEDPCYPTMQSESDWNTFKQTILK